MKIDVVILWVDGSDVVWQKKNNQYLEQKIDWKDTKQFIRYSSINEIEISITSILKNADFVNNIFLVTDNQSPKNFTRLKKEALDKEIYLELIDHKVIFEGYEKYLPTFNCLTIEPMLYKIPNLSEHFIYFNDDVFLINKTKPEDFFIDNKPVLRGKWLDYKYNFENSNFTTFNHMRGKEFTARRLGFKKHYNFHHTPHPMRKSTIENYFKNNPEIFENNLKYKFRNQNQFLLQGLVNHIEIKNKTCVFEEDLRLEYTHFYSWFKILKKTIRTDFKGNKIIFLCLQGLASAPIGIQKYLIKWIDKKLDTNFSETN